MSLQTEVKRLAMEVDGNSVDDGEADKIVDYLTTFGYLSSDYEEDIVPAIKQAQKIVGIRPTGLVDDVTYKALMHTPRCGCSDASSSNAYKQFAKQLNKWGSNEISYTVRSYVRNIPQAKQEEILIRAWESWEKVCGIRLTRVRSEASADIVIDSSSSRKEEFGTAGNVLAWAQVPQGQNHSRKLIMKFDLAENWSDDVRKPGILLEAVACHEFGHLLGIYHTNVRGELMYPTYSRAVITPQRKYDIPQALSRYPGKGLGDGGTTPPPTGGDHTITGEVFIDSIPYRLVRVN